MKKYVILVCVILLLTSINAQTITNTKALQALANRKYNEHRKNKAEVEEYAKNNNIPVYQTLPDGTIIEMQYLENGKPFYYMTNNLGAAKTTRADDLWLGGSLGPDVTGAGYDKLGIWDGGGVLQTHQELNGRVTQVDVPNTTLSDHSTHVAGTLIATGIDGDAKGMAYESDLDAYDWNTDEAEMALAASAGMELSNHSYGIGVGWLRTWNVSLACYDIYWLGDISVSTTEDYNFGYYSSLSAVWDEIAYDAPYYLIVKSAGNDRGEDFIEGCTGDQHYYYIGDQRFSSSDIRAPDGGADGYDCIPTKGAAKNILTIGAVEEVSDYSTPSDVVMSDFSGWGPVDDGRIKPDLVGKGVSVYSTVSSSNTAYGTGNGTSMSAPNVTGTLALLQQHYQNTHSSVSMRSATVKGLAIHTADEAGTNVGPDYMFGWGLLNAKYAAELISLDSYGNDVIDEQNLLDDNSYTRDINSDGTKPLRVTICWTDPPGTPVSSNKLNNRTSMLVNDLDLKLSKDQSPFYPWKLDYINPGNVATNDSENNVDNVEQVYIAEPAAGTYTIEVSHDGNLTNESQAFSIIVSGDVTDVPAPEMAVSGNGNTISDGDLTPSTSDDTDFGNVALAGGTNPNTFIITNSGNATLNLTDATRVTIAGTHAADFTLTTDATTPVAPLGTTTFTITFNPSVVGLRTATVSIANNDSDENPYDFSIQGTGTIAPEINLKQGTTDIADGGNYDYGSKITGTDIDIVFTIENTGTADLTLTIPLIISGTNANQFSIQAQPSTPVSASDSTLFTVRFSPTSVGSKNASIAIANNDSDENAYGLTLNGEGSDCINGSIIYNTVTEKFNFCEDGLWMEK